MNVKRVRRGTDKSEREVLALTFGIDKQTGANGADALIEALEAYRGKQVNLDIRLSEKETKTGQKFDSAFVIVKEMIPKGQATTSTFTPKNKDRAAAAKASADRARATLK